MLWLTRKKKWMVTSEMCRSELIPDPEIVPGAALDCVWYFQESQFPGISGFLESAQFPGISENVVRFLGTNDSKTFWAYF